MVTVIYAECRKAKCRCAECHYAECRYAECRCVECRYWLHQKQVQLFTQFDY